MVILGTSLRMVMMRRPTSQQLSEAKILLFPNLFLSETLFTSILFEDFLNPWYLLIFQRILEI